MAPGGGPSRTTNASSPPNPSWTNAPPAHASTATCSSSSPPTAPVSTELKQAVRQYLRRKSIEAEQDELNLDNFQRKQASTKREQFDSNVDQRIGETYVWVLTPSQTPSDTTVTWEENRVSGNDPLAVRLSKRLRTDEGLISEYSGARLRMDLDRIPLWRGEHVNVRQLWSDYSQYLYLPRLRDSNVLLAAVWDGVASLTWNPETFAYATGYDEATGRYTGLVAATHPNVTLDGLSLVVKPDVAYRHFEVGNQLPPDEPKGVVDPDTGKIIPPPPPPPPGSELPVPFYGRVALDPVRLLKNMGDIAEAVTGQLSRAADSAVTITVEIEAEAPKGFSDDLQRTVTRERPHSQVRHSRVRGQLKRCGAGAGAGAWASPTGIRAVNASIGRHFGPSCRIWSNGQTLGWVAHVDGREHDRVAVRPDADAWARFWTALDACGVWTWTSRYVAPAVVDGTIWSLYLDHQGQTLSAIGSNAYPPGWDQLQSALEEL